MRGVPLHPTPVGEVVRQVRPKERGLLLIYPLDPHYFKKGNENAVIGEVVIGLGLSFPASETAEKIDYEVNQTYWREELFA